MSSRSATILALALANNKEQKNETEKKNVFDDMPIVLFEEDIGITLCPNVSIEFLDVPNEDTASFSENIPVGHRNPDCEPNIEPESTVDTEVDYNNVDYEPNIEPESTVDRGADYEDVDYEPNIEPESTVDKEADYKDADYEPNIEPESTVNREADYKDADYEPNIELENTDDSNDFEPASGGHDDLPLQNDIKRKRKSDPNEWGRVRNKKLRMEGAEYYASVLKDDQGNRVKRPARKVGGICECNSVGRSCKTVKEETRNEIFNMFWKLSWENKKNYVRSLVRYEEKKRCYVQTDSRRKGTFYYHLQIKNEKISVCKKMFLNTLGVKERSVRDWVNISTMHGMVKRNDLKRAKTTKQKGDNEKKNIMLAFINSIPKLPSHYCRADSKKLYLEESFKNKTELYDLYKKHCEGQQNSPLSICSFMSALQEMNISIHQPKKDQCDLCCSHKVGNISEEEYRTHIGKKEQARNEKTKGKEAAVKGDCHLFTMDVQAIKLCPMLYASKLYLKCKLQVHNFSIYNLTDHHCANYCWNETEGEVVASVFTTCILKHLETFCLGEKKPIILYSDGCGYQNRNVILANALLDFAVVHGVTIFQKYLEKGHTQMEVDSAHSLIERKLKGREIHLPSQYPIFIKEARKNPSRSSLSDS